MSTKKPNYIWTTPSVIHMVIGADHTPTNELEGTGTLGGTTKTTACYRAGNDVSTDVLDGLGMTVTGRAVTGETFTPDKAGTYIYLWEIDDEGEERRLKTKYIVAKAASE